jgi:hypothetical protein
MVRVSCLEQFSKFLLVDRLDVHAVFEIGEPLAEQAYSLFDVFLVCGRNKFEQAGERSPRKGACLAPIWQNEGDIARSFDALIGLIFFHAPTLHGRRAVVQARGAQGQ